ncbi:sugar O-acyltransferase, sialic acid O-acetyltransferase NeuD family [Arachidicoccus rhizosphaerae]|uniref:Sugar O-acyltransferase, sialic acid O-acetyltransferase NeuD family n=1 Tax=Arachidicoccus rhizosphaerae TaxID=551991 RepID=A0A1H4CPK3_9BACT|nr:acetyltransferase [Arachidicoccus rhizosphaerae]SEA62238.1 sugar O-acyltransferase, sialic acid O-acetyltransferase NeuD family [Arachidicoccus rhizosphaerae]
MTILSNISKNLILIGGGGHCQSCIDVIEQEGKYKIWGILDERHKIGQKVLDYEIIGDDNDILGFCKKGCSFLITVGQIQSAAVRKRIYLHLKKFEAKMATVVSPLAYLSSYATLSEGTIVMHRALINAGANIGVNCILNTGCLIEHNARIGDHSHISTLAIVNGDSTIGNETFIGSNGIISNQIAIGNQVIIGAGSTVVTSTGNGETWVGVPAKKNNR